MGTLGLLSLADSRVSSRELEGGCALARMLAMSTFPTGSYAPLTIAGRSSCMLADSLASFRIAAMSTLPIGWYSPLTTSLRSVAGFCRGLKFSGGAFCEVNSVMFTLVG